MVNDHNAHQHWSNKKAFILAAIASAVGVGNIWRFPYMAAANGGGSFILPYLIAIALVGIPVMILEFFVGSKLSRTPLCAIQKLSKKYYLLGYVPLLFTFIIASYYVVVTGWTLAYFFFSLSGIIIPFSDFIQTDNSIYSTFTVVLLLFIIMRSSIKKGLEKLNMVLTPLFMLSLLVLLVGALSTYGADKAIEYYTKVDPAYFFNFNTWTLAFSQAFFSLGVGFGLLLTYAGYSKSYKDMHTSSLIVSIVDTLVALLAGILIFSLAFGNNIPMGAGPGFAFESLLPALNAFPFSSLAVPLFFLLLFAAALTSAASLLEVPITMAEDLFELKRPNASKIVFIALALASLPSALSYSGFGTEIFGMPFLDFMDAVFVGKLLPIAVLIFVLFLSWGYKPLKKEISKLLPKFLVNPFLVLVKYLIPMFLLLLSVLQFV